MQAVLEKDKAARLAHPKHDGADDWRVILFAALALALWFAAPFLVNALGAWLGWWKVGPIF